MYSFNVLPVNILNIKRDESLGEQWVVAEAAAHIYESEKLSENEILDLLEKEIKDDSFGTFPTFKGYELAKLFRKLYDNEIDVNTFKTLTDTCKVSFSREDFNEETLQVKGDFALYDIGKYLDDLDKSKVKSLKDYERVTFLKEYIADWSFLDVAKEPRLDNLTIKFADAVNDLDTSSKRKFRDDLKDILLDGNISLGGKTRDYLFDVDELEDEFCGDYIDGFCKLKRESTLGDNILTMDAINRIHKTKEIHPKKLKEMLDSHICIKEESSTGSKLGFQYSFTGEDFNALANAIENKQIFKEDFKDITKTYFLNIESKIIERVQHLEEFDIDVDILDFKGIIGDFKVYDIQRYLENLNSKDFDANDYIEIDSFREIVKEYSRLEEDCEKRRFDATAVDKTRLSNYLITLQNSFKKGDLDYFTELVTDDNLYDTFKSFDIPVEKYKKVENQDYFDKYI